MQVVNYTKTREELAKVLDNVINNNETTFITKNGKTAVMISLDEFNSWQETLHLLKSKRNIERLLESVNNINTNKLIEEKQLIQDE